MNLFKAFVFILVVLLAIYLAVFKKEKTIVVENENEYVEEEVFLPEEKPALWENEETEFFKINYDLKSIEDEIPKSDIERYISDRVSQFKTEGDFKNLTENDKEVLGFNRGMKYTLDFFYELKESKKIKTYIVKTSVFTGGAHGNLEVLTFNYEKATGKRISLNDVFTKNPSEYLPVLAALGDKFLQSEYSEIAFYEGLAPQPSNWATWYATDTSLKFIFQTYQVVPYAYGTPEFEVAAKGVGDFINLKYFSN